MNNLLNERLLTHHKKTAAGRESLRRFFCFCAFSLFFLLNGLFSGYAQCDSWEDYRQTHSNDIEPFFIADTAHCGIDGQVRYGLRHQGTGEMVTPGEFLTLGLDEVRIYRKTNPEDSAYYHTHDYMGGVDSFPVNMAGTFYFGVVAAVLDAVCYNDTVRLTIFSDYAAPQTPAIAVEATSQTSSGRLRSLVCDSTGRIQLKIIGGKYPFITEIRNHDAGDVLFRIDTLWEHTECNHTDSTKADFCGYQSIENLPVGVWKIHTTDACKNSSQYAIQSVDSVLPPAFDRMEVLASPPGLYDSNIVQVNVVLKNTIYEFYVLEALEEMQYCFFLKNVQDSDQYRPLSSGQYRGSGSVVVSDTVSESGYDNFCKILNNPNKTFVFKLRYVSCGDTIDVRKEFDLESLDPNSFRTNMERVTESAVPSGYCDNIQIWHDDDFSIYYRDYIRNQATTDHEHEWRRYHYTYPLVWTDSVLVGDTYHFVNMDSILEGEAFNDIGDVSRIYAQTLMDSLGVSSYPFSATLKMELKDAKGCPLYQNTFVRVFNRDTTRLNHRWKISKQNGDHCCETNCTITLTEENVPLYPPVGNGITTISLIGSPYEGRYNFTVQYNAITREWSAVQKDEDVLNTANIIGYNLGRTPELRISQPCLPSGHYHFLISSPNCGDIDTTVSLTFGDVYANRIASQPQYETQQECANLRVKFTGGQVVLIRHHEVDGHDVPSGEIPCNTEIRIKSGPLNGYNPSTRYGLGDNIHLSIPGRYVFELKPVAPSGMQLCEEGFFDDVVIEYTSAALVFSYAEALLCKSTYDLGKVFAKAVNGTEPIWYYLYKKVNSEDVLIDSNTVGVFYENSMVNFMVGDTLKCIINDACEASNTIDPITPLVLSDMQKVWVEGGGKTITRCQGESVHVYALQVGEMFSYTWYYDTLNTETNTKDEVVVLHSSSPNLFLSHDSESRWYHVRIETSGVCGEPLEDSVLVNVISAPSVKIETSSDTVCPNSPALLAFTPSVGDENLHLSQEELQAHRVNFSIAFSNADGITQLDTFGYHNTPVYYEYVTSKNTKVYPISVDDEGDECGGYYAADPKDTMYIIMNIWDMDSMCVLTGSDTTVCYNGDALMWAKYNGAVADGETIYYNWYADYAQTKLLYRDAITIGSGASDTSFYYPDSTKNLTYRKVLFVNVEHSDLCASTNGIATDETRICNNCYTELGCRKVYRFFDTGGEFENYRAAEDIKHVFYTTPGNRVMLHFDSLNLAPTSRLYVFSGNTTRRSALIAELKAGDPAPEYLLSTSDTMTLSFKAGRLQDYGWNAIIQQAPGIAVADVRPQTITRFEATVCQNHDIEDDDCPLPFQDDTELMNALSSMGIVDSVKEAIATSSIYEFSRFYPGEDGKCDSTVQFTLRVLLPSQTTSMKIISSIDLPYTWKGHTFYGPDRYRILMDKDEQCGCDSVEILNLVVLDVDGGIDPYGDTICDDESLALTIGTVTAPATLGESRSALPTVGDVLCTNGEVLSPDSFLIRRKNGDLELYPKGVVIDVEYSPGLEAGHGLVIGLRDASPGVCQFSKKKDDNHNWNDVKTDIPTTGTTSEMGLGLQDMEGRRNTNILKSVVEGTGWAASQSPEDKRTSFMNYAPAVYYCYYYDHRSCYDPHMPLTGKDSLGWYLPAVGELYRYFVNRDVVNATLRMLRDNPSCGFTVEVPYELFGKYQGNRPPGCSKPLDCKYHTSTEYDDKKLYRVDYKGMANQKHEKWLKETDITIPTTNGNITMRVQGGNSYYSYYIHLARAVTDFEFTINQ